MLQIHTIDCDYLHPRFAAAYLITDGARAAFVDNNTSRSVPKLLARLASLGLSRESVELVIITHVHLDHAGGTSELMRACPRARLLAHPRAAPHMIDPSKLVSSARKVYGDAEFERMYGAIGPIEPSRVQSMGDGEEIAFGFSRLRFLHTRGHANHHFCVHLPEEGVIFTGDAFGLRYPDLQARGLFIFPSTSPTDFDPGLAKESVDRIVATGSNSAYLTHFDAVTDLRAAAKQLHAHLDFSGALLDRAIASPLPDAELDAFCEKELRAHFAKAMPAVSAEAWELLRLDLELNAQGIAHVARKKRGQ